jgi:beta-galactosidase
VNGKWLDKKKIDNYNAIWNIQASRGMNDIQAFGMEEHQTTASDSLIIQLKFTPFTTSKVQNAKWDLGINVGSNCSYFDASTGVTWHPDQPYNKGSWGYLDGSIFRRNPGRIGTTATIGGTDNTPLYQTMRQDISAYQIDAPPGQYEIELHFADLFPSSIKAATLEEKSLSPEVNTFDIVVNGKLYWSGFSPYILSQGKANSAIKRTISFKNTNHQIRIEFVKRKGHSFLNALRIKQI